MLTNLKISTLALVEVSYTIFQYKNIGLPSTTATRGR